MLVKCIYYKLILNTLHSQCHHQNPTGLRLRPHGPRRNLMLCKRRPKHRQRYLWSFLDDMELKSESVQFPASLKLRVLTRKKKAQFGGKTKIPLKRHQFLMKMIFLSLSQSKLRLVLTPTES